MDPGGAGPLHARPNSPDQREEARRDAAHDNPSSADSPWPSGGRPGPSIRGGAGSRLESRPERGLAGGWDLRSAVDVIVWYVNSQVDL